MGYDFVREQDYFGLTIWEWPACLKIAEVFGWKAVGTVDPLVSSLSWCGSYIHNEGQWVQADDAREMALALGLAIEAAQSSSHHLNPEQTAAIQHIKNDTEETIFVSNTDNLQAKLDAAWAGAGLINLPRLRAFVGFCLRGGFRIT
jgi:hypothetical protein